MLHTALLLEECECQGLAVARPPWGLWLMDSRLAAQNGPRTLVGGDLGVLVDGAGTALPKNNSCRYKLERVA